MKPLEILDIANAQRKVIPGGVVFEVDKIVAGEGITITRQGSTLTIRSVGGAYTSMSDQDPESVGMTNIQGTSLKASRQDHIHQGVHSVNGQVGDVYVEGVSLSTDTPEDVSAAGYPGAPGTVTGSKSDHAHKGVHSLRKTGSAQLAGDVILAVGGSATLDETGQTLTVTAPPFFTGTPADVALVGDPGLDDSAVPKADHAHLGVRSINGEYGDVTIPGATLYAAFPEEVGATGSIGLSDAASPGDHRHKGVHSVNGAYGDLTIAPMVLSTATPAAVAATGSPGSPATADASKHDHVHQGITAITNADTAHHFHGDLTLNAYGALVLTEDLGSNTINLRVNPISDTDPLDIGVIPDHGNIAAFPSGALHVHRGVRSVNGHFGDVTIPAGTLYNVPPEDVAHDAATGASGSASPGNHIHRGVHSVNGEYGDITIAAGTLSNADPAPVGDTALPGGASAASRGDHAHKGVHSVNGSYGDVTVAGTTLGTTDPLPVADTADPGAVGTTQGSKKDHVHVGVTSFNTVSGDVVVDLLEISTDPPQSVSAASVAGIGPDASPSDHKHAGIHSLAKSGSAQLTGDATLTGSGGVTLTQASQNIDIAAATPATVSPSDVGNAASAGSDATHVSKRDHVHRGVHTICKSGSTPLAGDVTLAAGAGVTLTQTGQNVTVASTGWGDVNPTGTIIMFGGGTPPDGYLSCNGAEVSRTTYAALWAQLDGQEWGDGDGVTTFNLPDLRDKMPLGVGPLHPNVGERGGNATGTFSGTTGPATPVKIIFQPPVSLLTDLVAGQFHTHSVVLSGTNWPPYAVCLFCVKT